MRTTAAGLTLLLTLAASATGPWRELAPGLELGRLATSRPSHLGDSTITVLRIDPQLWRLEFHGLDEDEVGGRTARQWSRARGLAAVINAGMFDLDRRTHIGYLRSQQRLVSSRINHYQSVAAFDPRAEGLPAFRIFDLDSPGVSLEGINSDYASLVQNLRLIKRPGENRWSQQDRRWSEAALGEDRSGRILFIFCRSPFSMHDLNRELLGLDLDLVAAQHLEGGPEAQLYLSAGGVEVDLWGSYETAFMETDANAAAWPIPNVLGIRPRE